MLVSYYIDIFVYEIKKTKNKYYIYLVRFQKTLKWRVDMGANMFLRVPHKDFDIIKKGYPHYLHLTDLKGQPCNWEKICKIDLQFLKKNGKNIYIYKYMFREKEKKKKTKE